MSSPAAGDGEGHTTSSGIDDLDKQRALLAAVQVAVDVYGPGSSTEDDRDEG